HLLATGSYDERVMLWDTRQLARPLSCTNVGGGVWRLKWDSTGQRLLSVSMHNGLHVMDCSLAAMSAEAQPILLHYTQHEALVYGGDWCQVDSSYPADKLESLAHGSINISTNCHNGLIASCTFYAHSLHVWTF